VQFYTVHTLHHTLWLNTMLMREWDSWRLKWWRGLLTENHTVVWAVITTYGEKKMWSSDGKWGKDTDSPPPKHTHTQTHSKSNNVAHGEKNLWLIIVCVYWLLISTKSTLICLYNHFISSSLLLSFFFFAVISLSHTKKGEEGLRVLLLSDLIHIHRNWQTNMLDQQSGILVYLLELGDIVVKALKSRIFDDVLRNNHFKHQL